MSEGFTGKVKDFFGFGEIGQYDEDKYFQENDVREPHSTRDTRETVTPRPQRDEFRYDRAERTSHDRARGYQPTGTYTSSYEPSRYEVAERGEGLNNSTPQYVLLRLSSYKDATEVIDLALKRDVVVFTLAGVERGEASRALDFISGGRRALDANLKKLSGVRNFILIPKGITLEQSQMDQLADEL